MKDHGLESIQDSRAVLDGLLRDNSLSNVSFVLVRFHRLLPTHFSAAATTALRLFLWSVNRLVTEQVTALNHSPADNNVLSQRQQRY